MVYKHQNDHTSSDWLVVSLYYYSGFKTKMLQRKVQEIPREKSASSMNIYMCAFFAD